MAIGLIWGGVQALGGKDTRILVIAAAVLAVLQLISVIGYFNAVNLIVLLIAAGIVAMALQAQSKAWIMSKGGTTF